MDDNQAHEAQVAAQRERIAAANLNISFAEADAKAREYVRDADEHAEKAALTAAVEQAEREDEAARQHFAAVLYGEAKGDGKTTKDVLRELQEAVDDGRGW
ncbi:MAG TPA: hypothetical protein VFI15_04770 [Candidatus Limnocylindrales bacterium]|nr:hypothetical protein [Candidatus Limnocylindrales bacterium]